MARYRRIFAALDGGDTQEAVARRTLSIAHDNNADVLFGSVIDSSKLVTSGIGDSGLVDQVKRSIEEALEPYLKRASMDECVPSVTVEVKMGSKIAETLEKDLIAPFNPDLVICGVRGLSNIRYAFVGSVSTQLVHNMRCDVLVVHPEAIDGIPYEEYEPYGIEIMQ